MSSNKRLSIGYLVPGHFLLSSAGPTRNVLSLARALSVEADVTVAFRRSLEPTDRLPFEVLELEPGRSGASSSGDTPSDDAAIRGRGPFDLVRYLAAMGPFCREREFDVVLEKSWIFSGMLARAFRRRGIPGAVVENVVRQWTGSLVSPLDWPGLATHLLSQRVVRRSLRHVDLVIAETTELERGLRERFDLRAETVEVVGLGVDHERFRPADASEIARAREELGLEPGRRMLLYSGVLDRTHDLTQVLAALDEVHAPDIELHVVGDGEEGERLRALAREGAGKVVFHGRVSHDSIPSFLAAGDLCLAPYDLAAFPGGRVAYSTLKIPESMACARPVASVPEGRPGELIRHGVSGFLLPNTAQAWARLFEALPSREELARMGAEARKDAAPLRWDATAARYLELCERLARGT